MILKALIFDFDGTLLDTETPTYSVWREVYALHGLTLDGSLWEQALGTFGGFDPWEYLVGRVGPEKVDPRLAGEIAERIHERCRREELRPGVSGILESARDAGVRLAVASSSSGDWVGDWLSRHRIRKYFDLIVAREDVRFVKPAPDLFLAAMQGLRVEAEACLVIEDSPAGVLAASRAGMRCIAVPNSVTRSLTFTGADLKLDSLGGLRVGDVLRLLGARTDESPVSTGLDEAVAPAQDSVGLPLRRYGGRGGLGCVPA